jgi:hypothetical protein
MLANKMKEGAMDKKGLILLMVVVLGLGIFGCAGEKAMVKAAPSQIQPVTVQVAGVERLNAIAAKPPYQATDVIVFRVNFKLTNPNNILAKVDDFYFEAKAEDGTPDKTLLLTSSMPVTVIPSGGEIVWSWTEPYIFAVMRASYLYRGVGGEGGVPGVMKKVDEFWTDLGADKRKFLIDGNITTSLPDFSNLGTVRQQFKTEFTIPKL